jgi:pimeloyl-ACP methyl ester carboxylesterase
MNRFIKYLSVFILLCTILVCGFLASSYAPDKPVSELTQRWAQSPSQFIDVSGMQVHYRDEGPSDDPEPIVLIHGTGASLHTWDGWVDALKSQRRIIRFDLPAFGLTGPDPADNYTIEHYAAFVVAVLDKLNVKKSVLVGNSLGGYIAWATTVLYPSKVTKLTLVDASGYPYAAKSVPLAFKLARTPIIKDLVRNILPRSLIENSVKNVYGDPERVTSDLVDRYYDLSTREGNRRALALRFKQTIPGPLIKRLGEIKIPTLILWGEKDNLIPLIFANQFSQYIPNNQLLTFPTLGHVPHEEDPSVTVAAFKVFLAQ